MHSHSDFIVELLYSFQLIWSGEGKEQPEEYQTVREREVTN